MSVVIVGAGLAGQSCAERLPLVGRPRDLPGLRRLVRDYDIHYQRSAA